MDCLHSKTIGLDSEFVLSSLPQTSVLTVTLSVLACVCVCGSTSVLSGGACSVVSRSLCALTVCVGGGGDGMGYRSSQLSGMEGERGRGRGGEGEGEGEGEGACKGQLQ